MRISCSRCHAAYELPDEKLQRAAVKIRCSQCGHLFVARRRTADEDLSAVPSFATPELSSAATQPEARFEDFDFGSFGSKGEPAPEEAPEASGSETPSGDFDLSSFGSEDETALDEAPAWSQTTLPEEPPASEVSLDDFDLSSFGTEDEAAPEEALVPSSPVSTAEASTFEMSLDDFDLSSFGTEDETAPEEAADPSSLAAPREARGSEVSLDEFDLSNFGTDEEAAQEGAPAPTSAVSPEEAPSEESLDEFDLSSFGTDEEAAPEEAADTSSSVSPEATPPPEISLDDFDLSNFGLDPEPALADPGALPPNGSVPADSGADSVLRLDDFDLSGFGMGGEAPSAAREPTGAPEEPTAAVPEKEDALPDLDSFNFDDLEIPALGELDLGDFDAPGTFEEPADMGRFDEPAAPSLTPEREALERVRREELVSPPPVLKEVPVQGLSEDLPQLDLQRGRRTEKPTKSRLLARDRRHSPLLWFVLVVAAATLGYTGYNVFRHPEAFTFLNPTKLLEYWRSGQAEAKLAVDAKGYYRTFPSGRRAFVIRGEVTNHSEKPQGLIRVKGALFGERGAELSVREAYCGNLLNDRELANLPRETIEARLQNQVGEALSNVDIAPGAKVPFMLVFVPPPDAVEKYKVAVSAARAGSTQ